jgi:hypothetical protein
MAVRVTAIHVCFGPTKKEHVDTRDKPAYDEDGTGL